MTAVLVLEALILLSMGAFLLGFFLLPARRGEREKDREAGKRETDLRETGEEKRGPDLTEGIVNLMTYSAEKKEER